MDIFSFDPHKFTMDYHGLGFRECASEVARYLVGFEGMDLQDPVRMRLVSHLQCFSAQRDLAFKSAANPWSPVFLPMPQYPQIPTRNGFSSSSASDKTTHRSTSSSLMSVDSSSLESPTSRKHQRSSVLHSPVSSPSGSSTSAFLSSSPSSGAAAGFLSSSVPSSGFRRGSYDGGSASRRTFSDGPSQPSPVRPYRPWGTEMAY